jgi:peptidylprolyl isomerase
MFPNEIDARLSHDHAGAVGMANGGPGTNQAQWYITLGNRSYLDGDYTVFGEVVRGMEVVMQIRQGDALDTVRIRRVGKAAEAYHPTTASFHALLAAAQERVTRDAGRKRAAEAAWIRKHHPQATGPVHGVLTETRASAPAGAAVAGTLRVRYTGRVLRYAGAWTHYSGPIIRATAFASGPDGLPGFHPQPEVFDYIVGKSKLNPGLDALLASLRPGDHRIVIVPAVLGYGKGGFYPPDVPGRPRFIIGPNSLLVYDLTVVP